MGGEAVSFFADLSIVMVVAAAVGLIFSRFHLPLTVGYILAGAFVGPHFGPKLISNEANIQMLSDLGVMFLMFSIGIGFSFRSVRKLGGAVVFPALWDVAFMVLGGFLLGKVMGWGNLECFLLGLILCDSSTSIAAKTMESLGWLNTRFANSTFAIALIEDVLAILLIAVLNGVTGSSAEGGGDWWATAQVIGTQLGVLVAFLVGVVVFGILLVPRLMNYVCAHFDDEIVLIVSLGLCFGIACFAQNGLNLSLVVGAFLAGSIIAEAGSRKRIERSVKPVTNLFASVFFVSVGLMLNPIILWENIGTVLFISAGMILFKLFNNTVACVLMGDQPRDAFKVGIGMGQVAEFSFIIAGIAMAGVLTDRPLYQIAVGVALIGTATNPYLMRSSDKLYNKVTRLFGPSTHQLLQWYRQWLGTLRMADPNKGPSLVARIRNAAIMIAVDLVLCAIFFTGVHFIARLEMVATLLARIDAWQPVSWMHVPWRGMICTATALIVASPCLFAAQHGWHTLVRLLTKEAWTTSSRGLKHVQRFIRSVLHVVGGVGLFFFMALLASSFLQDVWIFGVLVLVLSLVMVRFSKRMRAGHRESREALSRAFDVNVAPPDDFPAVETIMSIHTETFILPKNALVHEKTLGELGLRGATGASVISVASRRNGVSITPGGETVLHDGDAVTVVGSDTQIAQAIAFLARVKK